MPRLHCTVEAATAFGWKRRNAEPRSMRDGDWLIGLGCATAAYPTHIGAVTARVRLLANGQVRVQTAAHEIGNGIYTVLAQLAAERLGVPLASVTVEVGDSNLPPAPVAGGSNTTASTTLPLRCGSQARHGHRIRNGLRRSQGEANRPHRCESRQADHRAWEGRRAQSGSVVR